MSKKNVMFYWFPRLSSINMGRRYYPRIDRGLTSSDQSRVDFHKPFMSGYSDASSLSKLRAEVRNVITSLMNIPAVRSVEVDHDSFEVDIRPAYSWDEPNLADEVIDIILSRLGWSRDNTELKERSL